MTEETKRMMIRCCCDAARIGTIPVPKSLQGGDVYIAGGLVFEVDYIGSEPEGIALKSREFPLDQIVAIPGFEPNRPDRELFPSVSELVSHAKHERSATEVAQACLRLAEKQGALG